jgi:hypothetical protein
MMTLRSFSFSNQRADCRKHRLSFQERLNSALHKQGLGGSEGGAHMRLGRWLLAMT